jgi:eukaryotic-like serine/threonine-protein kinase
MSESVDPLAPTLSSSPSSSSSSPPRARCPHPIPEDAPAGLCPRCALAAALAEPPPAPPLQELGEYQLEQLIARGGMGIVYRARHKSLGRPVALKMLVGGVWADDEDRVRFRAEAELAASLEHENIVPIYEVGEHDGQAYYAMRLMEESLAAHVERRGRLEPKQAAALVATVARAVHYGHRHGVVHRDLKPANLLLDGDGRPYVGDFGVSRRLGEARRHALTATGAAVGTPGYMAPEQAGAFGGDLTIAVDIWGLGAVLYELLCGAPPFTGASAAETIHRLLEQEPAPPRQLRPDIDRDLETVCMKCLEKPPERRYASALDLALDLERVGRGEPIAARRQTRRERLGRLWRRYPWRTGAATGFLVFVLALAVGSTLAARAQEQELAEEVLHTNAWVARSVAGAVDLELGKLRQEIARLADNPHLRYAVEQGAPASFAAPLVEPFDSVLFLDERGVCQARWPRDESFLGRDLSFRDYARDTAALGRGQTMVSAAFYSKSDGTVRFAVATPIFVGDRRAGVLAATLRSDSALGALSLTQEGPSARRSVRKVILLARHGAEQRTEQGAASPALDAAASPAPAAPADDWMILVHPDLPASGATAFVDVAALARLQANRFDPEYRDALVGDEPMLAGFAAVGALPFSVVVETPAAYAIAPNARWTGRVASAGALAALFGILVCLGSFALSRRSPSAPSLAPSSVREDFR